LRLTARELREEIIRLRRGAKTGIGAPLFLQEAVLNTTLRFPGAFRDI
jgi:hypothetical protein